jgi:hypothetical protein
MTAAAVVLGLAALGGMALAAIRLGGTPRPPTWMALGHGAVAATGLVLLIIAAMNPGIPRMAQVALGVFVLAALGGLAMFLGFHLKQKPLPVALVLGHGLIAVTAYVLLLIVVFDGG